MKIFGFANLCHRCKSGWLIKSDYDFCNWCGRKGIMVSKQHGYSPFSPKFKKLIHKGWMNEHGR